VTHSITRTLSFFSKWLAEVVRQPSLMLTLIVGPFLILLAFGQGVSLGGPRPRTVLVDQSPAASNPAVETIAPVPSQFEEYLEVVGTETDPAEARTQLREGKADLVVVLPPDALATVQKGQRAKVQVFTNEIDPVKSLYAHAYLRDQIGTLNQQTLEKAIGEAQAEAAEIQPLIGQARTSVTAMRTARSGAGASRQQVRDLKAVTDQLPAASGPTTAAAAGIAFVIPGVTPEGQPADIGRAVTNLQQTVNRVDSRMASSSDSASSGPTPEELTQMETSLTELERASATVQSIPAWVLSAPFELQLENVARFVPTYIDFYAPAVVALLLQHLAITLGALSMARIRLLGLMELLRTSPVKPTEVVAGNYLSYGTLCAVAGAILMGLLVYALGVPQFGSWYIVGGMLGLLVLCSLGIGFVISMIASSEQQAAQIAMLVLIASVFFSGFIVSLDTLIWPFRGVAYALPATYAVRTLQDVMLRGVLRTEYDLLIMGGAALFFLLITIGLFRREYRPR